MVGTVGRILGDSRVNIAGMQVSRDSQGRPRPGRPVGRLGDPGRGARGDRGRRSTRPRCAPSTWSECRALRRPSPGRATAASVSWPCPLADAPSQASASRSTARAELVLRPREGDPDERVEPAVDGERPARARPRRLGARPRRRASSAPAASWPTAARTTATARRGGAGSASPAARVARAPPARASRWLAQPLPAASPSSSSRSASSRAATSCSRTGEPRSSATRAAIRRSMQLRGAADPADPEAAPESSCWRCRAVTVVGRERGERPRHRPRRRGRSGLVRLVDDRDRAGPPEQRGVLLALGVAHQVAGGVLEVGDQVGQARPRLAHQAPDRVEVPAVHVHRAPAPAGRRRGGGPRARWGSPATPRAHGRRGRPAPGRRPSAPTARPARPGPGRGRWAGRARRTTRRSPPGGPAGRWGSSRGRRGSSGRSATASAYAAAMPGSGRGGGAAEVDQSSSPVVAGSACGRAPAPAAREPGVGARALPGPANPLSTSAAYARVTVVRETPERDAQVALAGQPEVERRSGRRRSAAAARRPARRTPGLRSKPPASVASRGGGNGSRHAVHCLTIGY